MFFLKSKKRKFADSLGLYLIKSCGLIFKASAITFVVYFSLEQFKTGLISNYFDLNILLILAIITGLLFIWFPQECEEDKKRRVSRGINSLILAILSGFFIYQHLNYLGTVSWLISFMGALALYAIFNLNLNSYD
ncbi:hypothetical protein KJ840_04825 [Patescibacteria group bacterium]|nr:hypothetical protein [Patescibacteria group bacterium]